MTKEEIIKKLQRYKGKSIRVDFILTNPDAFKIKTLLIVLKQLEGKGKRNLK